MGAVSFSGLSSGLDTASIVQALVKAERIPITRLEGKQDNLKAHKTVFQAVKDLTKTLETKAKTIDTPGEFFAYSATSSDEDVLTAAADGTATPGTYAVTVNQLAYAERTYSDPFNSATDTGLFGEGTLTISINGEDTEITVDANSTLSSLISDINTSNARADASLFFDGTNYRMQISGQDTGADYGITFTEGGTLNLGLTDPLNEVQVAQDAEIEIDGFTVTRPTNIIDDSLKGVTLNLKDDNATVNVVVAADTETMRSQVQEFLDAYNSLQGRIAKQFTFDGEVDKKKPFGDSTLRNLQGQLSRIITSQVDGLTGDYTALSTIGITTQQDGTLKLDATKFDDAFNDDRYAVSRIFASDTDLGTTGITEQIQDLADQYTDFADGLLSTRITGFDDQISDLNDQIDSLELRLLDYEEQLTAEFTRLELLMADLQTQQNTVLNAFK